VNTDTNIDWLTPEVKEMIDKQVEKIESGCAIFYTHEEVMREMDELFEQLEKERKEYACV